MTPIAFRIALLLGASCSALAQQATSPGLLPVVEVIGRYDDAIGLWDAASQGAVTREGIQKRPLFRPGEILESLPGMVVTQHSGDGKANQYFLRGYNLDHGTDFATWVSGMPVNMPTHAHGHGYTDLNFVIPELVGRVLFRKGPYFAQDGDFASAGTAIIDYADRLPASVATATVGGFGYRRGLLAGSPAFGAGALLYGFEYLHNDGAWEQPNKFAKLNGVLRYAQGTAADHLSITAMAYRAHWNSTDQIPQRAVDAGLVGRYGALDPSDGGGARRYSLSGEWRQAAGGGVRTASLYAVCSRLDLYSNFTFLASDPINGDQFAQSERRTLLGGALAHTWGFKAGDRDVSTTVGLQFRRDRVEPVRLALTSARRPISIVREDDVVIASAAPYLSNVVAWKPWLRTVAGMRVDHQRFQVTGDEPRNAGSTRATIASPKLSLVLGPFDRVEYFVNWGKGFHSNDARGTTITVDPATGAPADRVPALVRTKGHELGLRAQPVKPLSTSVALWKLDQESELLFVGDAGTTEPSRPSRRRGIEWLVQFTPIDRVSFDAALALTNARFSNADPAGRFIPGTPERVASAGLTFERFDGWFGSLRWRYFGPRPLIEDDSVRSKSTSLVNARIGRELTRRTRLSLDIYNLFDRRDNDIDYFYESQLAGEPAPVADRHFHPVERRTLRASVSMTF